jgi:hypothetical protein
VVCIPFAPHFSRSRSKRVLPRFHDVLLAGCCADGANVLPDILQSNYLTLKNWIFR